METKYSVNKLLVLPSELEGNYINLPEKVLSSIHKKYNVPYFFKIIENKNKLISYGMVKEFTSNKKTIELSKQIQEEINYGEYVKIVLLSNIPKGHFVKFKVNDNSLYEIPDYDLFLQNELSKFNILYLNQKLFINIMDREFIFIIEEIKIKIDDEIYDGDLIDINNIDLNIDFNYPQKEIIKENNNEEIIKEKICKLSKEEVRLRRLKYYENL